jgi:translocation and assembly module TamB
MRRPLRAVLALAAVAVALVLGSGAVLALTAPGHRLLYRLAMRELRKAVDGTAHLGAVRIASWRSVEVKDVAFDDPTGRPVLSAARVRASVSPFALLRGRFLIHDVVVVRPIVTLTEDSAGRWNLERLFRAVPSGAPTRGRRPLVDLRNARLTHGTLGIQPYGWARPVRIEGLELDLRRLRASDPDSTALIAEVRNVALQVRDPAVRIKRGYGHVVVDGDSVSMRLDAVELPGGTLDVRAGVRTRGGRTTYDLTADAHRFRFEDVAWLAPELPRSGGGTVWLRATKDLEGRSTWEFRDVDVQSGPSRVRGGARLATGGSRGGRVEALDLTAAPLDLALLAPLLKDLPLHGQVRGTVRGSGPLSALDVVADLAFTDAAAAGHPVSTLRGRGRLAIGGRTTLAFRRFALAPADLSLATIAGVAPVVDLHGRVRADGTLDGPWTDAAFSGALVHSDGEGPVSTARGTARLTLADTTRLAADLALDSLSFDVLARSYTGIPLRGSAGGRVRLEGPVTALVVDGDLAGPSGHVVVGGTVGARDSTTLLQLRGRFDGVDLARHSGAAPPTVLTGSFTTDLRLPSDTRARTEGTLGISLARSRIAGLGVDRAGLGVTLGAEVLRLDTLFLEQPNVVVHGSGLLGRPGSPPGEMHVEVRADTLAGLAPLVRWLRRQSGDSAAAPVDLDGAGRMDLRLAGTTAAWELQGELDVGRFSFGDYGALALHLEGAYASGANRRSLRVKAHADSLTIAAMRYSDVRVTAAGPTDAMAARVEATLPGAAPLAAAGVAGVDSTGLRVRIDSGTIRLPSATWVFTRPVNVAVTPETLAVDTLELRSEAGGRVLADGSVPLAGAGDFHLRADSVPVADLYALAQSDTAGIGGYLSIATHLTGTAASPTIEAYLTLADGRFGDFRTPMVDALLRYGDHLLTLKGGLWRGTERVLAARGSVPIDLSLTGAERRQLPGPIEIRFQADSVDLSALDAFTSLVTGVRGVLTADAAVGGTWDQPVLSGQVRVARGELTLPSLGQRWRDIVVRLEASGNRIHVAEARIGGGQGTLDIRGDVVLQDLNRPVLDLTLDARAFQALNRRDFAGITGTGTLRLTGPFLGAQLTGRLTVDEGFLAFADLVEKRIVNLDDPEFRAVVDSSLARAAELGPAPEVVFLDSLRIDNLHVTMGPSVWLRSSEANIQLAGDVTVSKTTESVLNPYRLDGTLRAVRGTYRLTVGPTSKDFLVSRGEVRFFGTPDLNPQLDIAAEHTVRSVRGSDLVVRARIGGTLLEPLLTLESDQRPPLSETEIVSYLLFGRPSFELVGSGAGVRSEQAVLQGAVAGLAGIAAGQLEQTLVGDLGLPIDYIAIRPGTSGDVLGTTRVEAGRQIGERTFLSLNAPLCEVRRGISSQLFGATLAYRLSGFWRLEASVEPLLQECRALGGVPQPTTPYQIGVDLFWQRGIQ